MNSHCRTYFWSFILCSCLLPLSWSASAENSATKDKLDDVAPNNNVFIFPTAPGPADNFEGNLVFTLGATETIQWITNNSKPHDIVLYHQDESGGAEPVTTVYSSTEDMGQQGFDWTVQLYNGTGKSFPVFFFWLNPLAPEGFFSHYFNVTKATTTTSSSSSTSSSISTKASSSTSATASTTTSATASSTTSATASSTTSAAANNSKIALDVGLGVGLGLGIPIVLILGVWIGI